MLPCTAIQVHPIQTISRHAIIPSSDLYSRNLTLEEQTNMQTFLFDSGHYYYRGRPFLLSEFLGNIFKSLEKETKVLMKTFHGGALTKLLRGEIHNPSSDIDFYFEITPPKDPVNLQRQILQLGGPLAADSKHWSDLFVDTSDSGSLSLTLPCSFNESKRTVDILIAWNPAHHSIFSSDSIHVDILSDTPLLTSVDGYPLEPSIAALMKNQFFTLPHKSSTVRGGLRFYAAQLTKGMTPENLYLEADLVKRFLEKDYDNSWITKLHRYLNRHFEQPYIERIICIYNLQNIIQRSPAIPGERKKELVDQLSSAMPFSSTKDARWIHMLLFWNFSHITPVCSNIFRGSEYAKRPSLLSPIPWEETEEFLTLKEIEREAFFQRTASFIKDFHLQEIQIELVRFIRTTCFNLIKTEGFEHIEPILLLLIEKNLLEEEISFLMKQKKIQDLSPSNPIKQMILKKLRELPLSKIGLQFYIASFNFKRFPQESFLLFQGLPRPLPIEFLKLAQTGLKTKVISPTLAWESFTPIEAQDQHTILLMLSFAEVCIEHNQYCMIDSINIYIFSLFTHPEIKERLVIFSRIHTLTKILTEKHKYHPQLLHAVAKHPSSKARTTLFYQIYDDIRLDKTESSLSALAEFLLSTDAKDTTATVHHTFILDHLWGHPRLMSRPLIPHIFSLFNLCFQAANLFIQSMLLIQLLQLLEASSLEECLQGLHLVSQWKEQIESMTSLPSYDPLKIIILLKQLINRKHNSIQLEKELGQMLESLALILWHCTITDYIDLYEIIAYWLQLRQKTRPLPLSENQKTLIFSCLTVANERLLADDSRLKHQSLRIVWFQLIQELFSERQPQSQNTDQRWLEITHLIHFWDVNEHLEFVSMIKQKVHMIPWTQSIVCIHAVHEKIHANPFMHTPSHQKMLKNIHEDSISIYLHKQQLHVDPDLGISFNQMVFGSMLSHIGWIQGYYDQGTFDSTKINAQFFQVLLGLNELDPNCFISIFQKLFPTCKDSLQPNEFLTHSLIAYCRKNQETPAIQIQLFQHLIPWMLQNSIKLVLLEQVIHLMHEIYSSRKILLSIRFIIGSPILFIESQNQLILLAEGEQNLKKIQTNMERLFSTAERLVNLVYTNQLTLQTEQKNELLDSMDQFLTLQLQAIDKQHPRKQSTLKQNIITLQSYLVRLRK